MSGNLSISLVNTASDEHHTLNDAEYTIGRGWLQCDDKRISRHHGILKVLSHHSVAVISTHQNCMFYRKTDDETMFQIEKDNEVQLVIGDSFGLLVDEFWFRIQLAIASNDEIPQPENGVHTNGDMSNTAHLNGIKRRVSSDSEPDSTNKKVRTEPNEFQANDADTTGQSSGQPIHEDMNVTAPVDHIASHSSRTSNEMPSTSADIPPNNIESALSGIVPHQPIKVEFIYPNENEAHVIKQEPVDENESGNVDTTVQSSGQPIHEDMNVTAPVDHIAPHSSSTSNEMPSTSVDIPPNSIESVMGGIVPHQPIRIEPIDPNENEAHAIKQEPVDENESGNVDSTNTVSGGIVVKSEAEVKQEPTDNAEEATTSSGSTNPPTQRRCCKFGIRCYRRNPLHRMQEAHPGDPDYRMPDYGEPYLGAAQCPFLGRCYRRNPDHFKQFSHKPTDGSKTKDGYEATVQPPPPPPPPLVPLPQRVPVPNYVYNNDDDDDDDEEEDPYASNSEDDPDFVAQDTPSESENTGLFDADTDGELDADLNA